MKPNTLELDRETAEAKSRMAGIRLGLFTLRLMDNWRRRVGDYDRAMILVAVAVIVGERYLRGEQPDALASLSHYVPVEELPRCNIASIAEATGLNRETARRKVASLVGQGLLVRGADGAVAFAPGVLQEEDTARLVLAQIEQVRRFAAELVADGILRIAAPPHRSCDDPLVSAPGR